jgi:hypothetical protein
MGIFVNSALDMRINTSTSLPDLLPLGFRLPSSKRSARDGYTGRSQSGAPNGEWVRGTARNSTRMFSPLSPPEGPQLTDSEGLQQSGAVSGVHVQDNHYGTAQICSGNVSWKPMAASASLVRVTPRASPVPRSEELASDHWDVLTAP